MILYTHSHYSVFNIILYIHYCVLNIICYINYSVLYIDPSQIFIFNLREIPLLYRIEIKL